VYSRVKICGITRPEDAEVAAAAGADAIGMVFYPPSARFLADPGLAAEIAAAAGPLVTKVALFVDARAEEVNAILSAVPVDLLQFHGAENCAECEQYRRPYIKAMRMREGLDPLAEMARYPSAQGFLLDSYMPGRPGGTGARFDWSRVPQAAAKPLILAGGLTVDNVASAVASTRPYGVDVSGGVEQAPGIKSQALIFAFVAKARSG
jgi:phosphoribosylanthranilate isomerase